MVGSLTEAVTAEIKWHLPEYYEQAAGNLSVLYIPYTVVDRPLRDLGFPTSTYIIVFPTQQKSKPPDSRHCGSFLICLSPPQLFQFSSPHPRLPPAFSHCQSFSCSCLHFMYSTWFSHGCMDNKLMCINFTHQLAPCGVLLHMFKSST